MQDKIAIEKGVPIPGLRPGGLADTVRKMKVGDSIVWPSRNVFGAMAQRTGYKFSTRAIDGGFRVWRVK